jgi:peptide/nickel transport system substrate-binding protein
MVTVCATVAACSSGPRNDVDASNTLTIDYGGDEYLLGPGWDDLPKFLVFLPLARWDNACRTGEHVGLAERWEFSPDRRQLTIHLRRDVRWHDSVPVTARDVEFNVNLWRHPDLEWYGAWGVDSVRVIDEYTVTMFRDEPGTVELLDWDVYYPRHLLENLEPAEFFTWDFWTHPIGNGPYRYVHHDPETHIEFEANPDYYEGEPAIKRVILTLANVPGLVRLRSGETDWGEADPLGAAPFIEDEDFNVYFAGGGAPVRIIWNVTHPLFRERSIRQALTLAIDRRAVARALGLPDDSPISDGTYSSCQFERREIPAAWPYDTTAAREILSDAGWRDTDGDGVLDRDGQAFRFLTIVSPRRERAGIVVQGQLAQIGIKMDVQMLEYSATAQRFAAGDFAAIIPRLPQLDFKLCGLETPAPSGYRNAWAHGLAVRISESPLGDERDRLYRELADVFYEELPGTYLYPRLRAVVVRSWLRGLDERMYGFPRVERLWIEHEP